MNIDNTTKVFIVIEIWGCIAKRLLPICPITCLGWTKKNSDYVVKVSGSHAYICLNVKNVLFYDIKRESQMSGNIHLQNEVGCVLRMSVEKTILARPLQARPKHIRKGN